MRTMSTTHDHLHLPHHSSKWWVGHTAAAVTGTIVVLYVAAVALTLLAVYVL